MRQFSASGIEAPKDLVFLGIDRDWISKVLATVVYDKAFFFFEGVGKPSGEYAISLADFCNKINMVPSECLVFHLQRGDFENWLRDIIGDRELSDRINGLRSKKTLWKNDATIRTSLHALVRGRIVELQDLWQQSLKCP